MSTKKKKVLPRLLMAGEDGRIYDHPDLLMLLARGEELLLPGPLDLMPLPPESELFLLPGRLAVGLDPESGELEVPGETAVAAFVAPGRTLTGLAAYATEEGAPVLPLFAYAAVGFAEGRMWVAARQTDQDRRQVFTGIDPERIRAGSQALLAKYPGNRLLAHLAGCALTSCCPAARNLALGRFECPLPTSRSCNARCVGCISCQPPDSGFPATQRRIAFTPTPEEIAEVMAVHATREKRPVFSFGQGCEGEPLTEAALIAGAVERFRAAGGRGTVNVNTNGSVPEAAARLAAAGVDAVRVSMNSARPGLHAAYYRPRGFGFQDVADFAAEAKKAGMWVSLNLLFFPGVTDTEAEWEALSAFIAERRIDYVQLRNLNLDPALYMELAEGFPGGPSMGLDHFRKRLKKACPWLRFGYFNPYLGENREPVPYA